MGRATTAPWNAGEKSGLDNGGEGDDEPLAAVQLHVRIRRALGVGFFARHLGSPLNGLL